jgi:hypothetical protein
VAAKLSGTLLVTVVFLSSCDGWTGPDGKEAPSTTISEYGGDCGNPEMTYLEVRGDTYARDVQGLLDPQRDTAGPFVANADLPSDAEDTGFQSSGRHLFIAPSEPDAVFIVEDDSVERWPRYDSPRFCA